MRMRNKKKVINRRALLDIRLARLVAELNRTVEEAYRSLTEAPEPGPAADDDAGQPASSSATPA